MAKSSTMFQFGSEREMKDVKDEARPDLQTVLHARCSVDGRLVCSGPTRLNGAVNGELVADQYLLVDRQAVVNADIDVDELVIRGRVKGNIRALKRVVIEDTAKVEGDIQTPAIAISDGAEVIGKIEVMRKKSDETPRAALDMETEAIVRKFAPSRKDDEAAAAS